MSETIEETVATETQEETVAKGPLFTIREMLEAGVHYGHKTMRWNPKMAPYIYGSRNSLHIIDLTQTAILLNEACRILKEVVSRRGKILFICTKKQGAETIAKMAEECGQYYVNNKWLGGMLTNWKTISQSIKKIKSIENQLADPESKLTKKEKLMLAKAKDKLERNLGGIKSMGNRPDMIFVIDSIKESLAINEARSLGIPVMAIADTNSDPDLIDYIIPGNDDSIKAIKLYCRVIQDSLKNIKVAPVEKKVQSQKKSKTVSSKKPAAKKSTVKAEKKDEQKETEKTEKTEE